MLIRLFRIFSTRRDGLLQLVRRLRQGPQRAVQIQRIEKSRGSRARGTVRARTGLAMLALCAAAGLPSAGLASSHAPELKLSPAAPDAFDTLDALGVNPGPFTGSGDFLDPDAAFALSVEARDTRTIVLRWKLADTYYLYRERFSFSVSPGKLKLDVPRLPTGTRKHDPYFGETEVYYGEVEIVLPVLGRTRHATEARLEVQYQGCTDRGLCYPPIRRSVALALPPAE